MRVALALAGGVLDVFHLGFHLVVVAKVERVQQVDDSPAESTEGILRLFDEAAFFLSLNQAVWMAVF